MSDHLLASPIVRARRIHELERTADDQREQLRRNTASVATGIRESEPVRQIFRGIAEGRILAARFSGSRGGWQGFFSGRPASGDNARHFPWAAALAAAGGAWRIIRWWKQRRQ